MERRKNMLTNIEEKIVNNLIVKGERTTYTVTSDLFYEDQIPVVAYLILSGNVHLTKNKKIKNTIGPGSLLGVRELMGNRPSDFTATIMPGTEVCFLSKSDIYDIISEGSDLSDHLTNLISA